MSNRVLVLDTNRAPLMPCHPARVRELLSEGKAAVYRRYPFTIILKDRIGGDTQPIDIKIDPGTKYTGMALVALFDRGPRCIYGLHIKHRGDVVRQSMAQRLDVHVDHVLYGIVQYDLVTVLGHLNGYLPLSNHGCLT